MIVRKPANECRTAEEYSAANLPQGDGSGIHLIAWVAAYEEVAIEHVERAIDTGHADENSTTDHLMREGMRIWLADEWRAHRSMLQKGE